MTIPLTIRFFLFFHFLLTAATLITPGDLGAQPAAVGALAPGSFRLIGTIESAPMTGAVFEDGAGMQTFFRLHDPLPDGSQIVKIKSDHVVLKGSDNSLFEVFLSQNIRTAVPLPPSPSGAGPMIQENREVKPLSDQDLRKRKSRRKQIEDE